MIMRHGPPPPCPFTETELRWLFERYQRCSFPVGSFPKRFARRNEFENLSHDKGWPMAAHLAFQYRRQIFKNSAAWDRDRFIRAVHATVTAKIGSGDLAQPPQAPPCVIERRHALHTPTLRSPHDPQLGFDFA